MNGLRQYRVFGYFDSSGDYIDRLVTGSDVVVLVAIPAETDYASPDDIAEELDAFCVTVEASDARSALSAGEKAAHELLAERDDD